MLKVNPRHDIEHRSTAVTGMRRLCVLKVNPRHDIEHRSTAVTGVRRLCVLKVGAGELSGEG